MANYSKTTNFAAKDALAPGNSNKIATAISTKIDGNFTNFSFTEVAGVLYIASTGTNVAKIDSSGNLTVLGNVIANGTI